MYLYEEVKVGLYLHDNILKKCDVCMSHIKNVI
jgi:hypothetical protein